MVPQVSIPGSFFLLAIILTCFNVTAITSPQSFNESKIESGRTLILNVDGAEGYTELIRNIRVALTASFSNGIPVLTPQPRPQSPTTTMTWLDIVLVVNNNQTRITVRLDASNLYARGYSRDGGVSFWEFSDSSLIPRSRSLQFSGSYGRLTATAGTSRQELPLGFSPLTNAVMTLARADNPPTSRQLPARSLLVIIQMISEAARFQTISDFIGRNWYTPLPITPTMEALENGWSRLSHGVQLTNQSTASPNRPLRNIPHGNPTGVETIEHAVFVLGILLAYLGSGSRILSPVFYYDQSVVTDPMSSYGTRPMMNLEYVRVNNIDGENPGDLYGTVRVDDGWYNNTFYERTSSGREKKGPGGFSTMANGSFDTAVSGEDAFVIRVSLWDYDSSSPDDEIAQGEIVWDPMIKGISLADYDKHLQEVVKGANGDVTMGYSVISDALSVTVDVVLIDGDKENPADVYGTVRASQVLGGSPGAAPLTLFERSSGLSLEVRPLKSIPLLRSVFAASVSSPLTVTVDLWDYDTSSADDQIAQGSVDFAVKPGTQTNNVSGKSGQVRVSLTCQ